MGQREGGRETGRGREKEAVREAGREACKEREKEAGMQGFTEEWTHCRSDARRE